MTTEQHTEILTELRAIRAALEAKPRPAQATTTASTGTPNSLPPPAVEILNAGEVQIHFGKNTGTPLSSLTDKQLLWYGADRPEQLKQDGTPFAPREADVLLKNACRTLWHQRKSGAPIVLAAQPLDDGEQVPF
jgi:hypothetical protein